MKLDTADNIDYSVTSFTDHIENITDHIENIVDRKFQKALRIIKKIRWQDHYNTRKRSRRF